MMRVVIDTNIFVSAVIKPTGVAGQMLQHLRNQTFIPVFSEQTFSELALVLSRPRIQRRYGLSDEDVSVVLRFLLLQGEVVTATRRIEACRDPKDNNFLEAAVAGQVDLLVSGDDDLLVLHPFQGIPIITLKAFLRILADEGARE